MDAKSAGAGKTDVSTQGTAGSPTSSSNNSPLKQIPEMGYVSLVDDSGLVNRSRSGTDAPTPIENRSRVGSVAGMGYVSLLAEPTIPDELTNRSRNGSFAPPIETRSRSTSVAGVGYVSLLADPQPSSGGTRTRAASAAAVDTPDRCTSVAGAGYVSLLADPSEPKVSLYIVSAKMKPTGAPLKVYGGQCHCGAVRFRLHAPQHLVAWDCNCSVCLMKKNTHFIVPENQFKLLPPVMERYRVHAGDALDYAKSAGQDGTSSHPLHWGCPPAEIDVPAWVWLNKAADSIDAPSVPEDQHGYISTYGFGSKTAKHTFCKICGVQAFYHPRSNPDGVAVTLDCLIPGALPVDTRQEGACQPENACTSEVRFFDGRNWEAYVEKSGIRAFSQAFQA